MRVLGCFYVLSLFFECRTLDPRCLCAAMFVGGWWMAFCGKRQIREFTELAHPMKLIGATLVFAGLAGKIYFGGSH